MSTALIWMLMIVVMILSYVIRRLPYTIRSSAAILRNIP